MDLITTCADHIHWLWLVPACVLGVFSGVVITSLCVMAADSGGPEES